MNTHNASMTEWHESMLAMQRESAIAQLEAQKKRFPHMLHLVLSIFTGGLWLIVWACMHASASRHNKAIQKAVGRLQKAGKPHGTDDGISTGFIICAVLLVLYIIVQLA